MGLAKLFVVDTGPLVTLAAAGALDCLLLQPQADVVIPDAVFYGAARDLSRLGGPDLVTWVKANHARIEIAVTEAHVAFETAREFHPAMRQAGLGEQAALEVIEDPTRRRAGEQGVLLCEESALMRRVRVNDRSRLVELSTMDFLRLLESEGRIPSAEQVFERALAAGRPPSRPERHAEHDRAVHEAVAKVLALARETADLGRKDQGI